MLIGEYCSLLQLLLWLSVGGHARLFMLSDEENCHLMETFHRVNVSLSSRD